MDPAEPHWKQLRSMAPLLHTCEVDFGDIIIIEQTGGTDNKGGEGKEHHGTDRKVRCKSWIPPPVISPEGQHLSSLTSSEVGKGTSMLLQGHWESAAGRKSAAVMLQTFGFR